MIRAKKIVNDKYPDFSLGENASAEQIRDMAVKAMHDGLDFRWQTKETLNYRKTGAVAYKKYEFSKEKVFAGLPYTSGNTSLFAFAEYCEDGYLNIERVMAETDHQETEPGQVLNEKLGNTCSGATCWGIFSVCNSIRGNCVSYYLTKANGFLPVGEYKYDFSIRSFLEQTTIEICRLNGSEVMYNSYKLVRHADLLDNQPADNSSGHSVMAIEDAVVIYNEDGSINPDESYIMIQDQRAGFFQVPGENGEELNYSGRLAHKMTFKYAFEHSYIPLTTAEFIGEKAYSPAKVFIWNENEIAEITKLSQLITTNIRANYPMAVEKLTVCDAEGKVSTLKVLLNGRGEIGDTFAFNKCLKWVNSTVKSAYEKGVLDEKKKYMLELDVTLSTGETFRALKMEI